MWSWWQSARRAYDPPGTHEGLTLLAEVWTPHIGTDLRGCNRVKAAVIVGHAQPT